MDRKSDRTTLGRRNKRGGTEKWDQTVSPEIPDRGETSESLASLQQSQKLNLYHCIKHKYIKLSIIKTTNNFNKHFNSLRNTEDYSRHKNMKGDMKRAAVFNLPLVPPPLPANNKRKITQTHRQ